MKLLGHGFIAIDRLHLSGNFQKRVDATETLELAGNLKTVGPIHDPVVRKRDRLVLVGEGRIASHVLNGERDVYVKFVDCTDDEVEIVRKSENAHRNHNPEAQRVMLHELVDMLTKRAEIEINETPEIAKPEPRVRKKAPITIARERLAKERGITVESVRIAEHRSRERAEAAGLGMGVKAYREYRKTVGAGVPSPEDMGIDNEPPAEPTVLTLDMELDPQFSTEMAALQKAVDYAALKAAQALGSATALANSRLHAREVVVQHAQEMLKQASHLVRSLRPHSLCPACLGIDKVKRQCATCHGEAYVTMEEYDRIPQTLKDTDNPMVLYQGKTQPAADFFEEPPQPTVEYDEPDLFGGGDE